MAFTIYKNLDFADSMQFMIFSLGTSNLFSSLKDESITEKDYLHVIDVWNMLKEKAIFKNKCFVISWCLWKVYQYLLRIL